MDRQFVTFKLGEDIFGIDILLVREINRNMDITAVNRCPDFVSGLLNLRGQVVTVLDLAARLGIKVQEKRKHPSCVVLKTSSEVERNPMLTQYVDKMPTDLVGLLVDEIGDVVNVESTEIEPPAIHSSGVAAKFIEGVAKLDKHLLIILSVAHIVAVEHLAEA